MSYSEIIVFDKILTAEERIAVETYLIGKWDIELPQKRLI